MKIEFDSHTSLTSAAAPNGLSAARSSVAGICERTVRSIRPAEAVAELLGRRLL